MAVTSIMMLLMLMIFLYAIVGVTYFGANDPSHFGGVGIAMLTLFRTATLASWGDLFKTAYFGCDRWHAGVYESAELYDDVAMAAQLRTAPTTIVTKFGVFPAFVCDHSEAQPITATAFFFSFTVITAFVILSLFISVVTAAMIEVTNVRETHPRRAVCLAPPPLPPLFLFLLT